MAPSLRRPRPFSEDADGSRSRHCIMENLDTSNNNNNNNKVLEQKLLTLSALEAQREEKRRRMEEVFQQITSLQMEMKDLEAELGIMDHDIEEMEDKIQKSAAVKAASAATTTTATSRTTTKSAPPPAGTATATTAAAATTTTTTQTQMDEILTDPVAAMLTSQSPLPPPSAASAMLATSIIPSQEQLTEPTDHDSPPAATLAAASLRQQPALHQNPPFSVSSGSSGSGSSANRPMALVGQLQFTTTATTTTNTAAAAAVVTLSRKKPPPASSSSISSLSSSLPSAARAAASAAPAPQHHHQQQQPQQQTLFTTCRQQPPHQHQRQQSSAAAAEAAASSPYSHDQFPWSQKVYDLLNNTFRIPSFRDYQKEIINATLSGQDAFVLMRTGGGKSLTYQLPALLEGRCSSSLSSKKVTLCISPLLSLIQDQEAQMNAFSPGSALSFTSGVPGGTTEQARRWNLVRDASAGVCLILVTPEKVHKSNKLRNELQKLHDAHRLGRFVIDEAHCASQWGSDFRPDYAQLGILKRHFPTVPLLAVTATASPRVRNDVCRILGLCSPSSTTTTTSSSSSSAHGGGGSGATTTTVGRPYCFFRSTAHRPNLSYSVRTKIDGKDAVIVDMVAFIKDKYSARNGAKNAAAGIVYTLSRKDADQVAAKLCDYGVVARAYHSDVSPTQKQAIHASWMKNQTQVVVATIAFGLGINKPDVRFVFHHTISKTLEAYYQESGRAGRDGLPADCILYYSPKDVIRLRAMVHEQQRGEENLWPMIRYAQAHGNDAVCKAIMLDNLGEPNAPNPTQVQRENDGVTTDTRNVGTHGQTVTRILHEQCQVGEDLTMAMLVKLWRAKPDADTTLPCVQANPPAKDNLSVDDCERIIMALLVEQVFTFYVHWTAYQAVAYLRVGQRGHALLQSTQPTILVRFPKKQHSTKESAAVAKLAARKAVPTGSGEWLQVKPKAKRKKPTASATTANTAASKKKKATSTTSNKRAKKARPKPRAKSLTQKKIKSTTKTAAAAAAGKKGPLQQQKLTEKSHASEVIELSSDDGDDNEDDHDDDTLENDQQEQDFRLNHHHSPSKKRARGSNTVSLSAVAAAAAKSDDLLWDDDESSASEFEFTE